MTVLDVAAMSGQNSRNVFVAAIRRNRDFEYDATEIRKVIRSLAENWTYRK